jgi:ABC-type Fe3+-hydroxamate transport system substrate-binding protein
MYAPRDFTGLAGAIMALGELTGNPSGGIQAAARLTRSVKSVRGMLSGVKMRDYPAVFVAIGSNPLETCGKDSFLHALVREAGGKNVYSDRAGTIIAVSPDDARRRNPAYVVAGETFAAFDHSGAKNIVIDIGAAMSPGPGVATILVKLAKSFHPDIIP